MTNADGVPVAELTLTGIFDGEAYIRLEGTSFGSAQNVWVTIDDKPKAIEVYNTADATDNNTKPAVDFVFLVDNSGSMDEEADTIANGIVSWAQLLSQTLDIQYGVVGYDGQITGALDFCKQEALAEFLRYGYGTYRTYHFGGERAEELRSLAEGYHNSWNECGMAALRYADRNFTFRTNANRIYVNFTDEPNQTNARDSFSVESLKTDWQTAQGTIHSVYSETDLNYYDEQGKYYYYYDDDTYEAPWLMADYTGGSKLFTNNRFAGVSLKDLPVTGAMQNSYVIRFANLDELLDGQMHKLTITIVSQDGKVKVAKTFYITIGSK